MTKAEVLTEISKETGCSKSDAEKVLNAFTRIIKTQTVNNNDSIRWPDLGTFKQRFAKGGPKMNPLTKQIEDREPKTSVKFSPAQYLVKRG